MHLLSQSCRLVGEGTGVSPRTTFLKLTAFFKNNNKIYTHRFVQLWVAALSRPLRVFKHPPMMLSETWAAPQGVSLVLQQCWQSVGRWVWLSQSCWGTWIWEDLPPLLGAMQGIRSLLAAELPRLLPLSFLPAGISLFSFPSLFSVESSASPQGRTQMD